jgi:hypothetical protein
MVSRAAPLGVARLFAHQLLAACPVVHDQADEEGDVRLLFLVVAELADAAGELLEDRVGAEQKVGAEEIARVTLGLGVQLEPQLPEARGAGFGELVAQRVGELGGQDLRDGGPGARDQLVGAPHPLVEVAGVEQLFEDRLRGPRQAGPDHAEVVGRLAAGVLHLLARVRLEIEQIAGHLALGAHLDDGVDCRPEGIVVEHAAVDEPGVGGLGARELIGAEELVFKVFRKLLDVGDVEGRKGARER